MESSPDEKEERRGKKEDEKKEKALIKPKIPKLKGIYPYLPYQIRKLSEEQGKERKVLELFLPDVLLELIFTYLDPDLVSFSGLHIRKTPKATLDSVIFEGRLGLFWQRRKEPDVEKEGEIMKNRTISHVGECSYISTHQTRVERRLKTFREKSFKPFCFYFILPRCKCIREGGSAEHPFHIEGNFRVSRDKKMLVLKLGVEDNPVNIGNIYHLWFLVRSMRFDPAWKGQHLPDATNPKIPFPDLPRLILWFIVMHPDLDRVDAPEHVFWLQKLAKDYYTIQHKESDKKYIAAIEGNKWFATVSTPEEICAREEQEAWVKYQNALKQAQAQRGINRERFQMLAKQITNQIENIYNEDDQAVYRKKFAANINKYKPQEEKEEKM